MEILQLTTEIDEEGQLKINLPTNLEAEKVDLAMRAEALLSVLSHESPKGYRFP